MKELKNLFLPIIKIGIILEGAIQEMGKYFGTDGVRGVANS